MDIKETTESKQDNLKNIVTDILEVASETIGLLASPSTLWLMVLYNCSGGKGFNGFVTNPTLGIEPIVDHVEETYREFVIHHTSQGYMGIGMAGSEYAGMQTSPWASYLDVCEHLIDVIWEAGGGGAR